MQFYLSGLEQEIYNYFVRLFCNSNTAFYLLNTMWISMRQPTAYKLCFINAMYGQYIYNYICVICKSTLGHCNAKI